MKVSILVPLYDEAENLPVLYRELDAVLGDQPWEAEIILVDDGSSDGTAEIADEIAARDSRVRVIHFARNFGQTAAIQAGIEHGSGDLLIPMDGDLQNDPADIPRLVAKVQEGYDVVSGWRRSRKDPLLTRRLPSWIANRLISWTTGVRLHDYGCTLKAYTAKVLEGTALYGEMHRFVPVYASWRGGRVAEMEVNHRPRRFGKTHYGLGRTLKVLLDLITIKFLSSYSTKPAYVFGGLGLLLMLLGFASVAVVMVEKIFWDAWQHKMTMLLLATFLVTVAIVLISMGLLAELLVRVYHDQRQRRTYVTASEVRRPLEERMEASAAPAPTPPHRPSSVD